MKMKTLIIMILFALFLENSAQAREYHKLPLGINVTGPESIAFDCKGEGPYSGVSDGRFFKWHGPHRGWMVFAVISPRRTRSCDGINNSPFEHYCGRPLGLKFDMNTCELYIADSSFGLMKVSRYGGVATSLATGIDGIPFRFLNALDIDSESGVVYFTDTSTNYHRWEYAEAMTTLDRSGRLLMYDQKTSTVKVLLQGLTFANGVALRKNKDFVLVAETTCYRITRFWLKGSCVGTSEIFAHLQGRPDNINRNSNGEFWVAQNPTKPMRLDECGKQLERLDTDEIVDSSEVQEFKDRLWIGSVEQPYLMYTI